MYSIINYEREKCIHYIYIYVRVRVCMCVCVRARMCICACGYCLWFYFLYSVYRSESWIFTQIYLFFFSSREKWEKGDMFPSLFFLFFFVAFMLFFCFALVFYYVYFLFLLYFSSYFCVQFPFGGKLRFAENLKLFWI